MYCLLPVHVDRVVMEILIIIKTSQIIFTITANPMFILPWVYDIRSIITMIIHLQSKKQKVEAALTALSTECRLSILCTRT